MKVILIQDIKAIGRKGELHEVKDGYARNFLIAKGLAKPATSDNLAQYRQDQEHKQAQENKDTQEIESHRTALETKPMQVILKTGKNREVFDSVNKQRIKEYCESLGIILHQDDILLDHPIKEQGSHKVQLRLGKGISADLEIIVSLPS